VVAVVPDVSGDEDPDLLVGAPFANVGTDTDAGSAALFHGGATFDANADLLFVGAGADAHLGWHADGGIDMDGDGDGDVMLGMPGGAPSGMDTGEVQIHRGGAAIDGIADFVFEGAAGADRFGSAVTAAGDVNLNGFGDIVVGAWGASTSGQAVVLGDPSDTIATPPHTGPSVPALRIGPNPLRTHVVARLAFTEAVKVRARLFDVTGRRLHAWPAQNVEGRSSIVWTVPDRLRGSGVVFLEVDTGTSRVRKRLTLLR